MSILYNHHFDLAFSSFYQHEEEQINAIQLRSLQLNLPKFSNERNLRKENKFEKGIYDISKLRSSIPSFTKSNYYHFSPYSIENLYSERTSEINNKRI